MPSRPRLPVKASVVMAIVVIAIPAVGLVAPGLAAAATPPIPTATCNANVSGQIQYTTTVNTKSYARAKNDLVITIAPGQTSGSRTITSNTTYSGSVKISGGVSVNAGIIIANAAVKAGVSLSLGAAFQDGDSWSVGPYHNTTAQYRDAVAYAGSKIVEGQYTKWACGLSPNTGFWTWLTQVSSTYGAWNQFFAAMVWCDDDAILKSQYGTWSIQYDAASHC